MGRRIFECWLIQMALVGERSRLHSQPRTLAKVRGPCTVRSARHEPGVWDGFGLGKGLMAVPKGPEQPTSAERNILIKGVKP